MALWSWDIYSIALTLDLKGQAQDVIGITLCGGLFRIDSLEWVQVDICLLMSKALRILCDCGIGWSRHIKSNGAGQVRRKAADRLNSTRATSNTCIPLNDFEVERSGRKIADRELRGHFGEFELSRCFCCRAAKGEE
jgi:hypothetical protein